VLSRTVKKHLQASRTFSSIDMCFKFISLMLRSTIILLLLLLWLIGESFFLYAAQNRSVAWEMAQAKNVRQHWTEIRAASFRHNLLIFAEKMDVKNALSEH